MHFQLSLIPHTLRFRFNARTSRGAINSHRVWYLVLKNSESPELTGIGECAPLPGLSPEAAEVEVGLTQLFGAFLKKKPATEAAVLEIAEGFTAEKYPSIKFALETALLDYQNGGNRILFPSDFTEGQSTIPINGLIWMSDKDTMLAQIREKIELGFSCLKLKIGSLDFEQELQMLHFIRKEYPEKDLTIRVDANGAFTSSEAMKKLEMLAAYRLHSIEQPIRPGQWEEMAKLCQASAVPVALDEELIGSQDLAYKAQLLDNLNPPYIILKPTLVGGMASAQEWITLAESRNTGWWITSALESNIGLNAIAQFTAVNQPKIPQGLGTGQLYHNNIGSPLRVHRGYLHYDAGQAWNLHPVLATAFTEN